MPVVAIDAAVITDFASFHEAFQRELGFPEIYGHNMDAWIDCMSELDDPMSKMTKIHGSAEDPVVLHLYNAGDIPREVFEALNEAAAYVNWKRIEDGQPAILMLSYRR
jgi:RNAse (barnase) inhibitor barstar